MNKDKELYATKKEFMKRFEDSSKRGIFKNLIDGVYQ